MVVLTFRDLLAPFELEPFLQTYWGRKSLHIPGSPAKFRGLFDWRRVERALNSARPSFEGIRLVHGARDVMSHDSQKFKEWLGKGATLVIRAIEDVDGGIADLVAGLASDLNTKVSANCYASSPSVQGFDLHYGGHDVYVVQIKGRKRWQVYDHGTANYPLDEQLHKSLERPPGEPDLCCTMAEGDVLYLPRGHWHSALAETPSLHLTLGAQPRTGVHLLNRMVRELIEKDAFLRRDFPIVEAAAFGGCRDDSELRAQLERFRARLHEVVDGKLMDLMVSHFRDSIPAQPRYHFSGVWKERPEINAQTLLELAPEHADQLVHAHEGAKTVIEVPGHRFVFGHLSGPVTTILFTGERPFCANDVLAADPDLEWEALQGVLSELCLAGVLRLSAAASGG